MTVLSVFYLFLHMTTFYRSLFVLTRTQKPLRLGLAWAGAALVAVVFYMLEAVTR
jgi:hypothetical protein